MENTGKYLSLLHLGHIRVLAVSLRDPSQHPYLWLT